MSSNETWRKSSRSGAENSCVELSVGLALSRVRDSKNPSGPTLAVDLETLLTEVKSGHFDS
jgi:hypothetical protein